MHRTEKLARFVPVLECGKGGISGNPTLVVVVPGHENVATHTPVSTPAVDMKNRTVIHSRQKGRERRRKEGRKGGGEGGREDYSPIFD